MKLFPDVRVSLGRMGLFLLTALLATGSAINDRRLGAASRQQAPAKDAAALIESFRHVEVASVSDALEQTLGKKLYMTHRMRPIFPGKFAGFALTVHLKKEENDDPTALNGMLTAIDEGAQNAVYVMQVD